MMAIQYQAARRRENFPVASWLIPAYARPVVLAFYDFARGADELADHTSMKASEREAALLALRDSIAHHRPQLLPPWAQDYYRITHNGTLSPHYGDALLDAFLQDTRKTRYETWQELLDYCQLSAAPVGQMVLAACNENAANRAAADALCIVLQLLNHLQDLGNDYRERGRIYWPQIWLREAEAREADLANASLTPAWRQLVNRALDECELLLLHSRPLMAIVNHCGLRYELAIIWQIAKRLMKQLRMRDPLAERVSLLPAQYGLSVLSALTMLKKSS